MTGAYSCGNRRVLLSDPIWDEAKDEMEFRLTYEGPLYADNGHKGEIGRAPHKHAIRKVFHKQLKALWSDHPVLQQFANSEHYTGKTIFDNFLIDEFQENGYRFVPLVTKVNKLLCKVEVLMLRPGPPGSVLQWPGDIDNRLKTLFDALRKPDGKSELGGFPRAADEDPFFCLLQDDKLITHVVVETDTMLEPVTGDLHDVRLVIKVTVRSYGGPVFSQMFDGG